MKHFLVYTHITWTSSPFGEEVLDTYREFIGFVHAEDLERALQKLNLYDVETAGMRTVAMEGRPSWIDEFWRMYTRSSPPLDDDQKQESLQSLEVVELEELV